MTLIALLTVFIILKNRKPSVWTSKNSLLISDYKILKDNGSTSTLLKAIDKSLIYLKKRKLDDIINYGNNEFSIGEIISSLEDFKENLKKLGFSDKFFDYINENFIIYKSNADKVLFTGYYEASLEGSLKKTDIYRYPVYGRPQDLVKIDLTKFSFYKEGMGIPKIIKGRLTKDKSVIPFFQERKLTMTES
jgi:membrane-bound lytic murein transglycosylase A